MEVHGGWTLDRDDDAPTAHHSDTLTIPSPGAVDLWRVPLDVDPAPSAGLLGPDERARLALLRGPTRGRFAVAHGALRRVVAAYQGCSPQDADLSVPAGRRPTAGGGLELSLSHCADLAIVAVSAAPVGVDVETTSSAPAADLLAIATRLLDPSELEALRSLPARRQARAVLRAWTRAEALAKLRGDGLGDLRPPEPPDGATALADLDAGPGHVAAVALAHGTVLAQWCS